MIIRKGKHRAQFTFGLQWKKKFITKIVTFRSSSRYSLEGVDMFDVNKLFGLGYFPGHHKDSARFSWTYLPAQDRIQIWAYCYVSGERIIKEVAKVPLESSIRCTLTITDKEYVFDVSHPSLEMIRVKIPKSHRKRLSFPLGLYFGGNLPAPHDIEISIKTP